MNCARRVYCEHTLGARHLHCSVLATGLSPMLLSVSRAKEDILIFTTFKYRNVNFYRLVLTLHAKRSLVKAHVYAFIHTRICSGVARGNVPPRNPGKFAKDGKRPTSQPAVSLDEKFKFSLIFIKILLKFSK